MFWLEGLIQLLFSSVSTGSTSAAILFPDQFLQNKSVIFNNVIRCFFIAYLLITLLLHITAVFDFDVLIQF